MGAKVADYGTLVVQALPSRGRRLVLLVSLAALISWLPREAISQQLADQLRLRDVLFCIDREEPIIPDLEGWLPVGCEVIDCCPGCPGPEWLDLEVNWDATLEAQLVLVFKDLGEQDRRRVTVEGDAKWTERALVVTGKTVMLKGVPSGSLYKVDIRTTKGAMQAVLGEADSDSDGTGPSKKLSARADVKQYLGNYLVNNHRIRYKFYRCGRRLAGDEDHIVLNNNTGGDSAVILFDGHRGGCENDVSVRTTNTVGMGQVLSNGSCRAESFVFSDDNGFAKRDPSTEWTNASGDKQVFDLSPRISVPVTVWIVQPGRLAQAQADVDLANHLYNVNHVGVMLDPIFTDISANATATALLDTMRCENSAAIKASAFFTPGRENVYYSTNVLSSGGANIRGRACFLSDNQDVLGVASIAVPETLAHEFMHSCTLRHDDDDGVTYDSAFNLMISGGINRDNITEGQAFRVNMNGSEDGHINILQLLGLMTGSRNCEENVISAECPDVTLDVVPN